MTNAFRFAARRKSYASRNKRDLDDAGRTKYGGQGGQGVTR